MNINHLLNLVTCLYFYMYFGIEVATFARQIQMNDSAVFQFFFSNKGILLDDTTYLKKIYYFFNLFRKSNFINATALKTITNYVSFR